AVDPIMIGSALDHHVERAHWNFIALVEEQRDLSPEQYNVINGSRGVHGRMTPRIDLTMRALHRGEHRLDHLLVAFRRNITLWRDHEIAKNRPAGRWLKPRRGRTERAKLLAASRHRARAPEIGETDLIDLDCDVLGKKGRPIFRALGGDASKRS